MSEYAAVVLIVFLKSIVALSAVVGAIYLAYHEKAGWGWMIFLAMVLGFSSVRLGSGQKPQEEEPPTKNLYTT